MAYISPKQSKIATGNSTTATLGAAGVFTGAWEELTGFHGLTVLVDGTSGGTSDGTLELQFSTDGGITIHRNITIATNLYYLNDLTDKSLPNFILDFLTSVNKNIDLVNQ